MIEKHENHKPIVRCDVCGSKIDDVGYAASETEHFCEDCHTPADQEFRICVHCGLPMVDGMTNEGNEMGADFHCHEECFEAAMDDRYGKGEWRKNPSGEEGEYGGYYDELLEDGTWEDTGIFYTQWY